MFKREIFSAAAVLLAVALASGAAAQRRRGTPVAGGNKKEAADPVPNQVISGVSYLPGEVRVHVKPDQTPVIRIGMALAGATIVEFPESDGFFAVHTPASGDLVRVEKSPWLRADHHLVLRAGQDLAKARGPAASVTIQMRSGLNVVLWIYPARSITQQTHRCMFLYDRAEVVAGRRKTGLAVNLGEEEMKAPPAKDLLAETPPARETEPPPPPTAAAEPEPTSQQKPAPAGADAPEASSVKSSAPDTPLAKGVKRALKDAMEDPKKFKKWTTAINGLSVSSRSKEYDDGTRIALVAVRNEQKEPLRILPGNPELIVETTDEKGKTIQLSQIKKRYVETSASGSLIPGDGVIYYAIAYTPPILGKQQKLRVSVGQRDAADAPAGAILGAIK